jgi:hypothetical protein
MSEFETAIKNIVSDNELNVICVTPTEYDKLDCDKIDNTRVVVMYDGI